MKKTILDVSLKDKKVLIRCDFNVPIKDGVIVDDTRIVESLETIKYAIKNNAKVILLSHLGRVKEEKDLLTKSLLPVSKRLSELLDQEVIFINETRGEKLEKAINNMNSGDVLLIENTRFEDLSFKLESGNSEELGKYWASLGDIFINDAFGTIHRAHASNVGVATYLPNAIGFLVLKELENLEQLNSPLKPFVAILGGSKVNDKIGVIKELVKKADYILLGGGMSYTFLKASGKEIGKSLLDTENIEFCKDILKDYGQKIILPVDANVSVDMNEASSNHITPVDAISENEMGLDIGKETINLFKDYLKNAKTILWNGPMGVYEIEKYQTGTKELLNIISNLDAVTILGGGDIVAASQEFGYKDKVTHASTGGGATLEYLEGKTLPGLEVIENKE